MDLAQPVADTRPVLIIDGKNLYMRAYVVQPDMASSGLQVGGIVGFLKSLKKLVSELNPSQVIVAWEGGGSSKRKSIYADYKAHRVPERLNRFYEDDIPDTEDNRIWQMITLINILKKFPINQLYVSDCEGDDIIAYLCNNHYKDNNKIIVSTDRDYYQLLNSNTKIFSPQTKRYHTTEDVKKEYFGINTHNFALAKAFCGDKSDNIPGVKGLGYKTLTSKIPMFVSTDEITIDNVIDFCRTRVDESKVMKNVVDSENLVRQNWRLIYLGGKVLSFEQMEKVDTLLANYTPTLNMIGFMKDLVEHGIRTIENPHLFCSAFMSLTRTIK